MFFAHGISITGVVEITRELRHINEATSMALLAIILLALRLKMQRYQLRINQAMINGIAN
jgi:hypothetical protein